MTHQRKTVIVAGCGLRAGLTALLLDSLLPHSKILLVSPEPVIGGARQIPLLWSSIPDSYRDLLDPLVVKSWPAFRVAGPSRTERFAAETVLLAGEQLHLELLERLGPQQMRLAAPIARLNQQSVELASGEILTAREVVDAREPGSIHPPCVETPRYALLVRDLIYREPHGASEPTLYRELDRHAEGVAFAQYLPLTDTVLRETIFAPPAWPADAHLETVPPGATLLRMERSSLDARTLFGPEAADHGADALDFAAMLDGGIATLSLHATQIAARQIRIVA